MHKYETEIKNWMPLIKKISHRFHNRIAGFEDLINEGVIALIYGIESYTPDKGNIRGYLYNNIIKGIYNAAISNSFAVNVPSGSMRLLEKNEELVKNLKGTHIGYIDSYTEEHSNLYDNIHFEDDYRDDIIDVRNIIKKYDENEMAYLYFFEGFKYEEISGKLGCSLATISRHINFIKEIIIKKCQ